MLPFQQDIRNESWRIRFSFENSEYQLVDFIHRLAQSGTDGCKVALEVGFLDLLLAVTFLELRRDDSSLWNACYSALEFFGTDMTASDVYASHPVRVLGSRTGMAGDHFLDRREALKKLEVKRKAIVQRIEVIEASKSLLEYPIEKPRTLDMCTDICYFARFACQLLL